MELDDVVIGAYRLPLPAAEGVVALEIAVPHLLVVVFQRPAAYEGIEAVEVGDCVAAQQEYADTVERPRDGYAVGAYGRGVEGKHQDVYAACLQRVDVVLVRASPDSDVYALAVMGGIFFEKGIVVSYQQRPPRFGKAAEVYYAVEMLLEPWRLPGRFPGYEQ